MPQHELASRPPLLLLSSECECDQLVHQQHLQHILQVTRWLQLVPVALKPRRHPDRIKQKHPSNFSAHPSNSQTPPETSLQGSWSIRSKPPNASSAGPRFSDSTIHLAADPIRRFSDSVRFSPIQSAIQSAIQSDSVGFSLIQFGSAIQSDSAIQSGSATLPMQRFSESLLRFSESCSDSVNQQFDSVNQFFDSAIQRFTESLNH